MIVSSNTNQLDDNGIIAASMLRNFENLGFVATQELFNSLRFLPAQEISDYYHRSLPILKELVGAHVAYNPMYPNFPQQVMDGSSLELWINAIIHYATNGIWLPEYNNEIRPLFNENTKPILLSAASVNDFYLLVKNLIEEKSSLSDLDREIVEWAIVNISYADLSLVLPSEASIKETMVMIISLIIKHHPSYTHNLLPWLKTATDVLRLVSYMSGGDVSLASNTKFRSFSRQERRLILQALNNCGENLLEDMGRNRQRFIRLGEILHPGEFSKKNQFPRAVEAFAVCRSNQKIRSFYGLVDEALKDKDITSVMNLLKTRPGEFARKLDHLFRIFPDEKDTQVILETFEEVVERISPTVLLQVSAHFNTRNKNNELRIFFPKGQISKSQVISETRESLSELLISQVVEICANGIKTYLSDKPKLGKVWIDPDVKNLIVPLAQRNASLGLKTFTRGSRILLNSEVKIIRGFIHWKNEPGRRTDVDLSLMIYNENWDQITSVSYMALQEETFGVFHSGDIVDAPEGASEFLDIDIHRCSSNGGRYAVFSVNSFSQNHFSGIPECFFGWMEREKGQGGEIYEPKVVKFKADLTTESKICLPVIFDLETRQAIWMDMMLNMNRNFVNNINGNSISSGLVAKAIAEMARPNLYDLFMLNVDVRGELVKNREEADFSVGFDTDNNLSIFEIDRMLTEFL